MQTVEICGLAFADLTYPGAVAWMRSAHRGRDAHHVVLANAHTVNCAWDSHEYRKQLLQASLTLRDGSGVKIASYLARQPLRENFCGTDFVPRLLGDLAADGVRVFLFGGQPGVAAAAAAALQQQVPALVVAGVSHGYRSEREPASVLIDEINAARATVLLVALGNPRQEAWIAEHLGRLDVRLALGVGALFDFLAGNVPRAPRWVRRVGCEWVYRLMVEPRRLWRRYVMGNPVFLYRVLRQHVLKSTAVGSTAFAEVQSLEDNERRRR